jgi:hypothetical protein
LGLKLNGTHQLLVYADDVNPLDYDKETIKKNTQNLIEAGKEVGLEVKKENTKYMKYMLLSRQQNGEQNHDIKEVTDVLKIWSSSNILERL